MAPPRQPRPSHLEDQQQAIPASFGRHIHAKEKDVLHKTLGSAGISKKTKPQKSSAVSSNASALSNTASTAGPNGERNNGLAAAVPTPTTSRPSWRLGPGSSEERMKWSTLTNTELNTWRTYLSIPISAPFSSESARISLQNPDRLGGRSVSMRGARGGQPVSRREAERAVAKAFESRNVDEEEVIAGFMARGEEERKIATRGIVVAGNGAAITTTTPTGSGNGGGPEKSKDRLGIEGRTRPGPAGNIFGLGRQMCRAVKCRSDMLI